jgi:sulfite exporter TauE/SafE
VIALALSVLVASMLGSVHCAAMCGGFVCAVSGHGRPFASQLAWHAGRGLAYVTLGAIAGLAGRGLERALAPSGLPHAAGIAAGALLVGWGLVTLSSALGLRRARAGETTPFTRGFGRWLGGGLRAVRDWPLALRGLAMGALTALLPCGWLWAFVASAAGTGHAASGALVMLAFWLGTVPLLAAVGLAAGRVFDPLRRRLPYVTAAVMITVGLLTVGGRFRGFEMKPTAASPATMGADCGMPGMGHVPAPAPQSPAGSLTPQDRHVAR